MKIFLPILSLFIVYSTTLFAKNTQVVFVQDDISNDFRKAQVLEVKHYIKEIKGIDFSYTDAKGKLTLFIYHLEKAIREGADIVLIGTPDASLITPALKKAEQKGIKSIIIDRGVQSDAYTAFVHSDNIEIGKMGAQYIVEQLKGKGVVLLLEGLPNADVTQLRTQGFMSVVAQYPQIKVIKRVANYLRKDAIRVSEKLLDDNVSFDAIFSESDSMLAGVRAVYKARHLDISKIISVGCDYTAQAQKAIQEGLQSASIKFPLAGKESVEVIKKLIANETVDKNIIIPVQLVTQSNVQEVEPIF